jgi:hypothetical protein
LPAWFHILNFPEILVQSGLLAFLIHHWVNHSEKRWLNLLLGIVVVGHRDSAYRPDIVVGCFIRF